MEDKDMKKMNYETPDLRVTMLLEKDVIVTSPIGDNDGDFDDGNIDPDGWT